MRSLCFLLIFSCLGLSEVQAQWQQTNGPIGGAINCFAVLGTTLFAGTDDGIYSSEDNGTTWNNKNNGLTSTDVQCVVIKDSVIYIGTDGGGIFRSDNLGLNWTSFDTSNGVLRTSAICISGDTIYAGTNKGYVLRSTDQGKNWVIINNCWSWKINFISVIGKKIFAGSYMYGLQVAELNWPVWHKLGDFMLGDCRSLVTRGNEMYLTSDHGIFHSSDLGETWIDLSLNLAQKATNTLLITDYYFLAGTVQDGVLISYDQGTGWNYANQGLSPEGITALAQIGSIVFAGNTESGIFTSNKQVFNWHKKDFRIYNTFINKLFVKDNIIFAATKRGLYSSSNGGVNWDFRHNAYGREILSVIAFNEIIIVGTNSGGVVMSTDNGITWQGANYGLPIPIPGWPENALVIVDLQYNEGKIYAATHNGIYRSADTCKSWQQFYMGINSDVYFNTLSFSGQNVYTANITTTYYSSNLGSSWDWNWEGPDYTNIIIIYDNSVLAGTNSGLYHTILGSNTWTEMDEGMGKIQVNGLLKNDAKVYAGTTKGVFVSSADNIDWTNMSEGFTSTPVSSLCIQGNELYAATYGHGIWKRSLAEVKDNDLEIYPNPVNNLINIKCDYNTIIEIFNLQGQCVFSKKITSNTATLDVSYLSNGIYILKGISDHQTASKKFIKD